MSAAPFHVLLSSLLHSGAFTDAAMVIEARMLDLARTAGEAALPPGVATVVDVPARAVENAIVDGTQKVIQGEPVGQVLRAEGVATEDRIAQAVCAALTASLPGAIAAALVPVVHAAAGRVEAATAGAGLPAGAP